MSAYKESSFDPHYCEKCFVFSCKKDTCPYVAPCFQAQKEHQKDMEKFVESLNKRIAQGLDFTSLSISEKINLSHLVNEHNLRLSYE